MSSTYSQELADSVSGSNEQECGQSRSAKSIHSADECSPSTGQASRSSTMYEHSPPIALQQMEFFPTQSAEDSPAKTSVMRDRAPDLTAIGAASGLNMPELLARFDRALSSWKTSQRCLVEEWEPFSEVWPRSGMMRSGTAYRLQPLVPYTPEIAFGLLPTPNATAFKGGRLSPRRGKANPERNNFQDFCSLVLGMRYPLPEFSEPIMGYPRGWTWPEIDPSETQSTQRFPKSSDEPSSRRKKQSEPSHDES